MRFALVLLLVASSACAGNSVSRGAFVKKAEFQTYGAISLFVDPSLGSDTNPCTASGASACLTFNAALNKLPKIIRGGQSVTITLANGSYTETDPAPSGFNLVVLNGTQPSFTIQGSATFLAITPATGTATGSQTAYAAASTTTATTFTDSTQTWTTNDLRGNFLTMTSGTQSGLHRIITANTGTVITLASNFASAPSNGDTYQIDRPGAVFTKRWLLQNIVAPNATNFTIQQLRIASTSAQGFTTNAVSTLTVKDCIFETSGTTAFSVTSLGTASPATLDNVMVLSTGGSSAMSLTNSTISTTLGKGLYVRSAGNGAIFLQNGGQPSLILGGLVAETAASQPVMTFLGGGSWLLSTVPAGPTRLICTGASSTGVMFGTSILPDDATFRSLRMGASASFSVTGCTTAFDVSQSGIVSFRGSTGSILISNATTAFNAAKTGKIYLGSGATITYSTVTNQATIDGVVFTQAQIDAVTPARVCSGDGSCVSRE